MFKKLIIISCMALPGLMLGAQTDTDSTFIFRFNDKKGLYKIKLESVNNVKDGSEYNSLNKIEENYTSDPKDKEDYTTYFNIDKNATHLRISIRKQRDRDEDNTFKAGGAFFIDASTLRDFAKKHGHNKRFYPGIMLSNKFDAISSSKNQQQQLYKLVDHDSILDYHRKD